MKKTTKFISAFMAAILCFNLVSFSAFAAEPSATETSFSAADLATYNQELADFGLNDDEIQQLQNITTKIANATTMREVDALLLVRSFPRSQVSRMTRPPLLSFAK